MLNIESVNHVGIRVGDKARSVSFYADLGFELLQDAGFDKGHPVIMKHPSGVVVNLLGPANASDGTNILMDVEEKHPGYTHIALTVSSLDAARDFMKMKEIEITGCPGPAKVCSHACTAIDWTIPVLVGIFTAQTLQDDHFMDIGAQRKQSTPTGAADAEIYRST